MKPELTRGVKWTSFANFFLTGVGMVRMAVLARFLEKEDFGLMALASFIVGIMSLFMDMGITSAILHKQNIAKEEYSSLYWLNFGFSILLFGLIWILASPLASFYGEDQLVSITRILGLGLILSALGRQFKTVDQKNFAFRRIAIIEVVAALASFVVGVYLAVVGWRVMALVYATLASFAVSNLIYLYIGLASQGITFYFSYQKTKKFLRIGVWEVMGQVVNYFNRELDVLLIGKLLGTEVLGAYNLAKQLVQKPTAMLNPIILRVATPYLAKIQSSVEGLKDNYFKILNMVMSINLPVYMLIILFADPIVRIYYGADFVGIVPLVQILSGYFILRAVSNPVGSLLIATGRTDLGFYWNVLLLLVFPLFVYAGHFYGAIGVAYSLLILMVVMFVPAWKILIKPTTQSSLIEYVKACIPNRISLDYALEGIRSVYIRKK